MVGGHAVSGLNPPDGDAPPTHLCTPPRSNLPKCVEVRPSSFHLPFVNNSSNRPPSLPCPAATCPNSWRSSPRPRPTTSCRPPPCASNSRSPVRQLVQRKPTACSRVFRLLESCAAGAGRAGLGCRPPPPCDPRSSLRSRARCDAAAGGCLRLPRCLRVAASPRRSRSRLPPPHPHRRSPPGFLDGIRGKTQAIAKMTGVRLLCVCSLPTEQQPIEPLQAQGGLRAEQSQRWSGAPRAGAPCGQLIPAST